MSRRLPRPEPSSPASSASSPASVDVAAAFVSYVLSLPEHARPRDLVALGHRARVFGLRHRLRREAALSLARAAAARLGVDDERPPF